MNSGLSTFKEMLKESTVTTERFHQVMSGLKPDNFEKLLAREYMEYLLHLLPKDGVSVHWQEQVTGYMKAGLIATMTIDEIIQVIEPGERQPLPAWNILAERVVLNRQNGDVNWRLIAIERHKMLTKLLEKFPLSPL